MLLEDKIAIITGAGSGMGRADALLFTREGAKVVIVDIDKEGTEETLRQVRAQRGEGIVVIADVSETEDVKKVVNETIKKYKKIDILVNNAGILLTHPITETTEEEWDRIFGTNIKAIFLMCKEVISYMLKQGKGKIINISSCGGDVAFPGAAPYCASKAAVNMLTMGLAYDYAAKGINVNAVAPGFTKTPMVKELMADEMVKKALLANIPAGRFAEAEDIAQAVLWLASENSNYCHGLILNVDGGWIIR